MPVWIASLVVGAALAGKNKDDGTKCPNLPVDQRPAVGVGKVTPQTPMPQTVPDAWAARLSTKLLTTGCFAIDLEDAASARYRISAVLTEFQDDGKQMALQVNNEFMVSWKARLGFVLTLTDTKTDAVLATEVFELDDKERILPSRRMSSPYGEVSPAMTGALEEGIAEVTGFLVPWRERLDVGG